LEIQKLIASVRRRRLRFTVSERLIARILDILRRCKGGMGELCPYHRRLLEEAVREVLDEA
jgi:hypothetical protein